LELEGVPKLPMTQLGRQVVLEKADGVLGMRESFREKLGRADSVQILHSSDKSNLYDSNGFYH